MIDKQFEELKHSGQLPSPSGVGMQILRLTQEENCSLDELVRAIQADPALTGRVLKLASSALVSGQNPVASVKEAAMRLGLRSVCNVALGFTLVAGNRAGVCEEFDYEGYWSDSLALGVAAQACSQALQIGRPPEFFTLGLLARIGELALASVHPVGYTRVLRRSKQDPALDVCGLEAVEFNIDHVEVAGAMMLDWGLPSHFAVLLREFEDALGGDRRNCSANGDLLRVLCLARSLADYCVTEAGQRFGALERFHRQGGEAGLSEIELDRLGSRVAREWKEWGSMLRISTADVPNMAAIRAAAPRSRARRGETQGTGIRILAVDDDPVALRLLAKHLETARHEVVTAANGRQALAAALEFEPHIVVTDWMMPEMDGLQLCKALRLYPSGKKKYILLLTGRTEEDRVVEAFDAGVDDYIVKPFKPKLLLARVRAGQRVVLLQDEVEREKKTQREQMAKLGVMTRKLREAAMTDPLTELANRRYAMRRLDSEWSNSSRTERPLAVIMIDIDHFKRINDNHGHDAGDEVLQRTAEVISSSIRRGDVVARIGGEEFLVICPDTEAQSAMQMAERVRASVQAERYCAGSFSGAVTVSAGVAVRSAFVASKDELLKIADEAAYRSKGLGRNRVTLGGQDDRQPKSA